MANNKRQGLSIRQYAKHAGTSHVYISKLLAAGKIPCLPDGSLDPLACDEARARNTIVGRGQRRMGREVQSADLRNLHLECAACGESYSLIDSRSIGTLNFERFCTPRCQADQETGLSRAQIRRKVAAECAPYGGA